MNSKKNYSRLRRTRQNENIRNLFATPMPGPEKFIMPLFVVHGKNQKQPISSMPGQYRFSIDTLLEETEKLYASGIKSLLLFGVVDDKCKTPNGDYAYNDAGLAQEAIRALKKKFQNLTVVSDICVCEYTSHGHCGILNNGDVDNDATLELLAKMAVSHAKSGADIIAPSAMMDGQVAAIRTALDSESFANTLIMSYSTKFASSMYGPFRDAADSAPAHGDRKSYQADYRNLNTALLESEIDEQEGADILMVKPAMFYLDVITRIKSNTKLPLAAYNVSGEYSMLHAQADRGWGDLKSMVRESIAAMSRAGTNIFISYWANQYNELIAD